MEVHRISRNLRCFIGGSLEGTEQGWIFFVDLIQNVSGTGLVEWCRVLDEYEYGSPQF